MDEVLIDFDDIMVRIHSDVLSVFLMYKQEGKNLFESGGILSGYNLDGYSYRITDASKPTRFDKAGKYFFNRAKQSAQDFMNKLFKKSKGKKIYLGEWHTHPEEIPNPSNLDFKSIKQQIKTVNLNCQHIFLLIVGRQKTYIGLFNSKGILISEQYFAF